MIRNHAFTLSRHVAEALAAAQPVVALESTIITHGMPYPGNLQMAREAEAIIRDEGAEPATIAVLDGRLTIGLLPEELERLATAREALKLSRADLAFAIATGRTGASTVAATMIAARLAGIAVFATGGIGGVHRGAETSFDISADLEELARTAVIVVAAGPKAILDGAKTLEYLETRGVPVVTVGQDEVPAFWSRESGLASPMRLDSADAIAAFQHMRERLSIDGGMLVANPIPHADEIPKARMDAVIAAALERAQRDQITGKAVTPYLLDAIYDITAGESLEANIALVKNNARLAARIAKSLAKKTS